MAIDSGVFAQFGPRPKSLMDYRGEMDTAAANALALKANQLQYQGALQGQQDEAAYRDAARNFTNDSTANYNMLMQRGLVKQAQALQKYELEAGKTRAETEKARAQTGQANATTAKTGLETYQAKLGSSMKILQAGTSPEAIVQMLNQSIQAGVMTPEEAQRNISDMPRDPAQFQQWRDNQLMQGMDIAKRIEMQRLAAQQQETARHNRATEQNAAGQLSVSRARLAHEQSQPKGQIIETENGFMLADPRGGTATPLTAAGTTDQLKGKAANRQLTEGQGKSTAFAMRAIEAENQLTDMPGYNPGLVDRAALAAPLDSGRGFASEDARKYDTAKRNFIASILRKETGAAVTKGEFEMYDKMYFPQVGDKGPDIEDKKRQRSLALEGLMAEAGPGRETINKNVQRKAAAGPVKVNSDADYNALPSGATFVGPDGKTRRKP